jgi:TolA-binding protein
LTLNIQFSKIISIIYSNGDNYLILAEKYEKENNVKKAVENYKLYLKSSNDDKQKEKIQLKIARINEDYKESLLSYKQFFNSYPKSDFLFIAKYELASLHKFNNNYKEALNELYELSRIAKNSPYWQKSMLEAATIEYLMLNYKKARSNINELLNEIDEYEDLGVCYFLMGKIMDRLNNREEAKEYYLICAGSFPQSSKAPTALLELLKLYLNEGKNEYAKKIADMIALLYSESPENIEAEKITKNIKYNQNSNVDIELINLNRYENKAKISSKKLSHDLKL